MAFTPYQKYVEKKRKVLVKLEEKHTEMMLNCSHPEKYRVVEHDGDTGNYDPSQDSYWTITQCLWCGYQHTIYKNRWGEIVREYDNMR